MLQTDLFAPVIAESGWINSRPVVPLIVAFGGGLNSTALLVLLRQKNIRPDLITFADTGGEKPETYVHVEAVNRWCGKVGFPVVTIVKNASPRAGYKSLEDNCLQQSMLPSRAYGHSSCADKWKIQPQNKYLKQWMMDNGIPRSPKPWKLLGYDGGESRRASIEECELLRYAYPLLEWNIDREECERICRAEGFGSVPKSACFYCPSSRKGEVLALARNHPDLFARAVAMERRARDSGNLEVVKGLGRHWAWEDLVEADEAVRARMSERPVESCTMCVDGDDDLELY